MKITEDMLKDIRSHDFILNKHDVMVDGESKTHWDIRVPGALIEWKMVANPINIDKVVGVEGKITNPSNVRTVGKVNIGTVETEITRLDSGTVQIIESTYVFNGGHLRGAWIVEQESTISKAKIFSKIGN